MVGRRGDAGPGSFVGLLRVGGQFSNSITAGFHSSSHNTMKMNKIHTKRGKKQ